MRRIIVTPAGRARYLRLLSRHLAAQASSFDEWHLWLNTTDAADIAYCMSLPAKIIIAPDSRPELGIQNIHTFFPIDSCDASALYLRLDDDIVWCDDNFVDIMFQAREREHRAFLVSANVINNAICSHLHFRFGILPPCKYNSFDPVGWQNPEFAQLVHREFLSGGRDRYKFDRWFLTPGERISINAISWRGDVFQQFAGKLPVSDEELWLTEIAPHMYGPVMICGAALCSHFAFHTQRALLDSGPLLAEYEKLAPQI
jgi:hypothetical protein